MIRETIITQMEDFREWRWGESDDAKVAAAFTKIHDQCQMPEEFRFVLREYFKAKPKDTPGRDPDRTVNDAAEKVLAHMDAHAVKVKPAAAVVLQDHEDQSIWFFDAVCKRAYYLLAKRRNPCAMRNSRLREILET